MRFKANQLIHFLQAVDRHLGEQLDLVVIGGTAALLAYGAQDWLQQLELCKCVLLHGGSGLYGAAWERAAGGLGVSGGARESAATSSPVAGV